MGDNRANYDDAMLSVKDIQSIFNCGRKQVYELIHIHGFPSIKIGGKYYVSRKSLARWIEDNEGKTVIK